MDCKICDGTGIIEYRHGLPVRCPECDGPDIYLYKLKRVKDGKYYNTRASGISQKWSGGGRFYTKQNLGNISPYIKKQCTLEVWSANKVGEQNAQ